MVNLNHIGNIIDEFTYEMEEILNEEEKKERINLFLDAVKNFNGGAKQARNLEDISPKFIVITKQKTGNPFLLNVLKVDKQGNLDIENLKYALDENDYDEVVIGLTRGVFSNEKEILDNFEVVSIKEAIDRVKQ